MTRFWRFTLLTLLIALLPLRGWAWAVMPVPTSGQAAPAAPTDATANAVLHGAHAPALTPATEAEQADASPPCHAHAAAASQDLTSSTAAPASDVRSEGHAHTCSLCDLCHAGVIAPPSWAWFHDAPPVSPPSWALSAPRGRDGTDGPFRPPRA